ncbi:hypothetical protein P3T73_09555 [Kiritimatiellota bacterium B12222]|nr:hypothetical protein P3T73_09555 [Kiritimatiellota bacterium B12222]
MIKKISMGCLGLLLLPAVIGLSTLVYHGLVDLQMQPETSHQLYSFLVGGLIWVFIFFVVTRPVRSYIFAHEMSHLLAAWMTGVKGGQLRVSREGGSVEVEKSTLWIALAPYMIPFYSLLLLALHALAQLWWDPELWRPFLPFALGITSAFHFTFTLYTLSVTQSDITPYGRIGAYSLIICVNLSGLCLALFFINTHPAHADLTLFLQHQKQSYLFFARKLTELYFYIKNAIIQG